MKVSKDNFERFKKEFIKWQKLLGLTQYRIDFFHEKLKNSYAEIYGDEMKKAFRVSLTTELDKDSSKVDGGPEKHARHEVLHLLIHRMKWLGQTRYIENLDLDEEGEAIVVRLENAIKELTNAANK